MICVQLPRHNPQLLQNVSTFTSETFTSVTPAHPFLTRAHPRQEACLPRGSVLLVHPLDSPHLAPSSRSAHLWQRGTAFTHLFHFASLAFVVKKTLFVRRVPLRTVDLKHFLQLAHIHSRDKTIRQTTGIFIHGQTDRARTRTKLQMQTEASLVCVRAGAAWHSLEGGCDQTSLPPSGAASGLASSLLALMSQGQRLSGTRAFLSVNREETYPDPLKSRRATTARDVSAIPS